MTDAVNWTNAKKKSEKLRRTGFSDTGSDYPNTPPRTNRHKTSDQF